MPLFRSMARVVVASIVVMTAGSVTAPADTSAVLRGGLSVDPDQFLVGAHLNLSPVGENVYIVPSAEAGFGDDLFTLSFNGDVQYRFDVRRGSEVRPYAGGGLTLYYVDFDGGSDSELGVSVLGGIFFARTSGNPMFLEVKAGLSNEVPDWKIVFGINL
jgi:hypothetical protein